MNYLKLSRTKNGAEAAPNQNAPARFLTLRYNSLMSTPTLLAKRFAHLPFFAFLCAPLFAAGAVAFIPTGGKASPPVTGDAAHTAPLLQTYCLPCHNDQKKSGGFNLAKFVGGSGDTETGRKILGRLRDRDMPPPGAKQPTTEEHDALQAAVNRFVSAAPVAKTPGRVLLHRLSRTEYNNSVRDVFGVTIRPADNFPADGSGGGGFDNNADTLYVPPLLMERYLEAAQTVADAAPEGRVFFVKPAKNATPTRTARTILEFFAARAFRRPLEPNEADPFVRLYEKAVQKGKPHEAAVRFALRAVLVSPSFLFRAEREPSGTKADADYPLSDYEMAARLSYFLWSSIPDDRLLILARQKKLHDPAVLEAETVRMLKSPKASAFADGFAGQWLHVRDLYSVAQPDTSKFSAWTPAIRDAAYQETIRTFQSVVQNNESLITLLNGNYTYLNHDLAQFYSIDNVLGPEMRRVSLPDGRRGGVLTQASVLTLTSYPLRTSPVLRGKWVLEEILGTPAPPPPANVATLNQDDHKNKEGLTFRQRLEAHRNKPECAGCHRKMDPLGFGLENFDAIGRWRDQLDGVPVDSSGILAGGATFSGPIELKRELLTRKDDFSRNVSEKMLAYALGRGIEPTDAPTVRALCEKLAQNDYHSQTLVVEIVKSYPFGYKAVEKATPTSAPTKVASVVNIRK